MNLCILNQKHEFDILSKIGSVLGIVQEETLSKKEMENNHQVEMERFFEKVDLQLSLFIFC